MRLPLDQLLIVPLEIFLATTAGMVLFKLFDGTINMRGLLRDRRTGRTSSLKVQKLIATLTFASTYAASITGRAAGQGLPPVSTELLALVGGSNALLLVNHGFRYLRHSLRQ